MTSHQPFISVIIPVYMAQEELNELIDRIIENIETVTQTFEIILVNDASPDSSWKVISELSDKNPRILGISLSRNFGQHPAIFCGLSQSIGDWVVVMDCDFQDNPDDIPRLYKEARKGFDMVLAKRKSRNQPWGKRLLSRLFYKVLSYMTEIHFDDSIGNFGIYSRKVVNATTSLKEYHKTFSFSVHWVGFSKSFVPVDHNTRRVGSSTYSMKKLFNLAENIILAFTNKPLALTVRLGFFISLCSLFTSFYYLYLYITGEIAVLGYTSIILSIWFLSGLIIFCMGIIGTYLGKVFETVKNRPLYIISEMTRAPKFNK